MKITVDMEKCQGYGQCPEVAPSVFSLDDLGLAVVAGDGQVPPGDEDKARDAIRACPMLAISES